MCRDFTLLTLAAAWAGGAVRGAGGFGTEAQWGPAARRRHRVGRQLVCPPAAASPRLSLAFSGFAVVSQSGFRAHRMCFPKTKFRVLFGPATVFPDLAPASSWTRAPFTPRERLLACSALCLPRPQEPRRLPLPVSQLRLRLRLSRCWARPLSIYFPSVSCFSSVDVLCGPFRILLSYCLVFLSHVCQFPLLSLNKVTLHTTANSTEVSIIPRNMCTCAHTVYSCEACIHSAFTHMHTYMRAHTTRTHMHT